MKKNVYSLKEACMILHVSDATIRRYIKSGDLKAEISSNKKGYKINREDLKSFAVKNGKVVIDIDINNYKEETPVEKFINGKISDLQKIITESYVKNNHVDETIIAQYNLLLEIQEIIKSTT